MKLLACCLGVCALWSLSASAQDLGAASPRADYLNPIRVLLYVPGSDLLLDYPDVTRVCHAGVNNISFQTSDGAVVTHQGAYTIIQARNSVVTIPPPAPGDGRDFAPRNTSVSSGRRFYDVK